MSGDELRALAAAATVVDFAAGAVVADYTRPMPDDVWMVREGRVDLQAGDGTPLDTVQTGGLFGYTPLLTGGGMDFIARTALPSNLIRLPDAAVRAQFAKPAGLAYLARRRSRRRARTESRSRPSRTRRPSPIWSPVTCWSSIPTRRSARPSSR